MYPFVEKAEDLFWKSNSLEDSTASLILVVLAVERGNVLAFF